MYNANITEINLPLLNPTTSRPIISNDGALAWYERNIIKDPTTAGRLFNNKVCLLERQNQTSVWYTCSVNFTGVRVNLKRTAVSDTETNQAIKITGPEGIIFFVPKRFTKIKL